MKELIILWIVGAMTMLSPPHRTHFEQAALESYAQADARYRDIAEAIVDESFAGPALFGGTRGRIHTSMMVMNMFFMESGFRRDIDLGTSSHQQRRAGLNDYGRSWCMGQINLGYHKVPDPEHEGQYIDTSVATTPEGWTGPELVADRRKCVRATINALKRSMGACPHLPAKQQLAVYASGKCDLEDGKKASESRMGLFFRWRDKGRPSVTDADVINEVQNAQASSGGDVSSVATRVLRLSP